VALLKWLMKESWGIDPEVIEAEDETYRLEIKGTTAGLVIGDRGFGTAENNQLLFMTWVVNGVQFTGLPFVFAAWVSTKITP
jgi:chorismate dehydratase